MGRKKKMSTASVVAGLVFAPVTIAVGVGKALREAQMEKEKHLAQIARIEQRERNAQIQAAKKAAAERARQEKENLKLGKANAAAREKAETERSRIQTVYSSLEDRYSDAFHRHNELTKNLATISLSENPELAIACCQEDCHIIPQLFDYFTRKSIIDNCHCELPAYDTFLVLSRVYQALRRYDYAILACQDAIDLGLISAGTEGSMEERIAALKQEKNQEVYQDGQM